MESRRVRGVDIAVELKILIDMNLTPEWVSFFHGREIDSEHRSEIGDPKALDVEIMDYARDGRWVVFTHDLDFGNILAVTQARGPSVIQARVENSFPDAIGDAVVSAIIEYERKLQRGALITLDPDRLRARILPIISPK